MFFATLFQRPQTRKAISGTALLCGGLGYAGYAMNAPQAIALTDTQIFGCAVAGLILAALGGIILLMPAKAS